MLWGYIEILVKCSEQWLVYNKHEGYSHDSLNPFLEKVVNANDTFISKDLPLPPKSRKSFPLSSFSDQDFITQPIDCCRPSLQGLLASSTWCCKLSCLAWLVHCWIQLFWAFLFSLKTQFKWLPWFPLSNISISNIFIRPFTQGPRLTFCVCDTSISNNNPLLQPHWSTHSSLRTRASPILSLCLRQLWHLPLLIPPSQIPASNTIYARKLSDHTQIYSYFYFEFLEQLILWPKLSFETQLYSLGSRGRRVGFICKYKKHLLLRFWEFRDEDDKVPALTEFTFHWRTWKVNR